MEKVKIVAKSIFEEFEKGKQFKSSLGKHGLFEQAKINERFYVGDQWWNADCGADRPLVRHNVIKRIGEYKMSAICASPVAVNYSAEGVPNTVGLREKTKSIRKELACGKAFLDEATQRKQPDRDEINVMMSAMSDYFKVTAERLKFNSITEQALRNAYISGTGVVYTYWDSSVKTGLYADDMKKQPISGDIVCEVLDIENVNFGDPNIDDVQNQPFIIIAQRKSVAEIKRIAVRNGVSKADISRILPDNDYSGGYSELSGDAKATMLTKLFKQYSEDGSDFKIKAIQVAGEVVIRDEWDLGVRMYPVCVFGWERRRGCIYGESEITQLVPNQIAINRMLTASVWAVMLLGMPIMAVNKNLIPDQAVTNNPGQLLEFTGMAEDIDSAVKYFAPPDFSPNFDKTISSLISGTLSQSGATDAALGDVKPDNTSAIIAVREAATMPLQLFKNRFYQFCEDIARVFMEFWVMMYGRRLVKVEDESGTWYMPFDGDRYKDLVISVNIDVGASNLWSEQQSIKTLDNLLNGSVINTVQYLERLPKGIIPNVSSLIKELKSAQSADEKNDADLPKGES